MAKKVTAKLKPIKVNIKCVENPAFKKQMEVVKQEVKKLSCIDALLFVEVSKTK